MKSYSSTTPRLYILEYLIRLLFHWEFISKKLDIDWSKITHQDTLLQYWDYTFKKLYFSLSMIIYIKTPYIIIRIIYLKGCILVYQRLDALSCFFRYILSLIWISGCLIFFILIISKKAIQKNYVINTPEANRKFLSLAQDWFQVSSYI